MRDLAFYNSGCGDMRGTRAPLVMARRAMRRVLRPFFLRLAEILTDLAERLDGHDRAVDSLRKGIDALGRRDNALEGSQHELSRRQDDLAEQLQTALALGWDQVAVTRRLACIENQLIALMGSAGLTGEDAEAQPSIFFPGLARIDDEDAASDDRVRSKVS